MTLATQKQDARKASQMIVPGGSFPSGEAGPATASPTNNTPSSTPSPRSSSSQGLSYGEISGIVIGGLVGLVLVGVFIFYLGRNRTELEFLRRDLHIRSRQAAPPDITVQYDNLAPTSPSLRYNPDDPRFGEHQSYDVPPYVKHPNSPTHQTPELASTEVVSSRPRSPWSDGGEKSRDTASPRPIEFMENLAPEVGEEKLPRNDAPEISQ